MHVGFIIIMLCTPIFSESTTGKSTTSFVSTSTTPSITGREV